MRADQLDFYSLVEFAPDSGAIQFSGRRAILLHTDAMGALRKELVETLGADIAKVILTRYGFSCGFEDAGLLPGFMHPDTLEEFVRGGPRVHMFSGIAEVETRSVEVDRERGHYRMSGNWRNSYEAEQHLRLFGQSGEAVCWTLAGYASGFASYVFQTDMICVEHECEGRGDAHCSWTLMNAADCAPEFEGLRKYFQPLNIKDRINVLEGKVYERTRELEASEQRYRNLIEDLPEMVFALHVSGRMLQLNKAGRTRLGITPEQLPNMRLRDLVQPEYRVAASNFLKSIASARAATRLDVVMRDAAGQPVPMRLQVEPVFKDDKIVGYSGLAIDITAQQERERKLTEYAARLENREQQIQDIINDAVYVLDLHGRFSFVNARMAELLGVPADRAIGRSCAELMLHSSALRVERDFRRRLAGEGAPPFEIMLAPGGASNRLLEVSSAVLSTGGRPEGVIGVARDITARREMERQLAQANRLSALGQFASGIAHEINNPLGLVSGFAEELQALMESIPGAQSNPDFDILRQGLTTIQEQAQRCKAITDNLLLFSRKQAVPLEVVDVAMLVRERLDSYRELGLTRGLDVELRAEGPLPTVATNPTLLDQVLRNLVKNARDAMDGRGRILVTLRPSGATVELDVLDEGPGLASGVIDHVFDPFFTTKAPGRGTGLGLSICYGIMSELGGRIECGNRPEGGAWFRIHLPVDEVGADGGIEARLQ
ncbi:PAS domain S-box protein [Aromatoleum toluclasticum]|uniref:PAS domain S-box protein n=1 Tax=Aromatoleum toluclasticum TaxID=92003 RepID=UPI000374C488|nr:PAS domain S-box protein [Aromatoleum toluclasticum]